VTCSLVPYSGVDVSKQHSASICRIEVSARKEYLDFSNQLAHSKDNILQ
jgi:hypothetical protein